MAEAEFRRQFERDHGGGDLRDQIHGVRLEVEKVRTDLARTEMRLVEKIDGVETRLVEKIDGVEVRLVEKIDGVETRLVEKIGGVEVRLVEKIGGVESRLGQEMTGLEARLSDRMDGLEKSLRGWLVIGVSVVGAMIALLGLFG